MQLTTSIFAASLLLAAPLALGSSSQHTEAADAKASVPATQYESAFSDYVPRQVDEISDWKEANAMVGSGGGHAGHNMGHAMPETAPAENNPHAGH